LRGLSVPFRRGVIRAVRIEQPGERCLPLDVVGRVRIPDRGRPGPLFGERVLCCLAISEAIRNVGHRQVGLGLDVVVVTEVGDAREFLTLWWGTPGDTNEIRAKLDGREPGAGAGRGCGVRNTRIRGVVCGSVEW